MSFSLRRGLKRQGELHIRGHRPVLETPFVCSTSSHGLPPYLTRDNVARADMDAVLVSMADYVDGILLSAPDGDPGRPFSLHASGVLPRPPAIFIGLGHPETPQEAKTFLGHVKMQTQKGTVNVDTQMFVRLALSRTPGLLFALDEFLLPPDAGVRAHRMQIDRSLAWVRDILGPAKEKGVPVVLPLIGGSSPFFRRLFSKAVAELLAEHPSADAVIGFSVNLKCIRVLSCSEVVSLVRESLSEVPQEKLRVLVGASGFGSVGRLYSDVGFDIVYDDWSYFCAANGVAVRPDHDAPLNLYDGQYAKDFAPVSRVLPTSRAYIHHLLENREMTAHILLAMGNYELMKCFVRELGERDLDGLREYELDVPEQVASAIHAREDLDRRRGRGSLREKRLLSAKLLEGVSESVRG